MKKTDRLYYYLNSLCVYDTEDNEAMEELMALLEEDCDNRLKAYGDFFRRLTPECSLKAFISKFILTNENAFSRAAAKGNFNELPKAFKDAVKSDLKKLEAVSDLTFKDIFGIADDDEKEIFLTLPKWESGTAILPLANSWGEQLEALADFHRENGYGKFVANSFFRWQEEEIEAVSSYKKLTFNDIKGYERQKQLITENVEAFLEGLPAFDTLLYGESATGKTSSVYALLNEFRCRSLRTVQLAKADLDELPMLFEEISKSPMKFIVFIDSIDLDNEGENLILLKEALPLKSKNALVFSTSDNIPEGEDVCPDCFGLCVEYETPNIDAFLKIVKEIASDRGIEVNERLLEAAKYRSTRSGRCTPQSAKQFVDYVESCEKRNINW